MISFEKVLRKTIKKKIEHGIYNVNVYKKHNHLHFCFSPFQQLFTLMSRQQFFSFLLVKSLYMSVTGLVLYKIPIRKTIGGNINVATVLHSSNWRKIEISTRKRPIRAMPLLKKKYKNPYRLTLSTNILYHYSSLFYRYYILLVFFLQ